MYKFSSNDLNAFDSPNFPPLVHGARRFRCSAKNPSLTMLCAVGIDIAVDWNNVIRQTGLRRFKAHKR